MNLKEILKRVEETNILIKSGTSSIARNNVQAQFNTMIINALVNCEDTIMQKYKRQDILGITNDFTKTPERNNKQLRYIINYGTLVLFKIELVHESNGIYTIRIDIRRNSTLSGENELFSSVYEDTGKLSKYIEDLSYIEKMSIENQPKEIKFDITNKRNLGKFFKGLILFSIKEIENIGSNKLLILSKEDRNRLITSIL